VAFAQMREIDAEGQVLRDYAADIAWEGATPSSRLESLLCAPHDRTHIHRCVPITGLMRAGMLARTRLIGRFNGSDKVALVELALLGDFAEVPARLFFRRMHAGTSLAANPSPQALRRWFDPKARGGIVTPRSRLFAEYVRAVLRAPVGPAEKAACARVLARLMSRDWRVFGGEIKRALRPSVEGPRP